METILKDYRHPYDCGKNYVIQIPKSISMREKIIKKEVKEDALVKMSETDDSLVLIYEFQKIKR